jgi:hypothetical protein
MPSAGFAVSENFTAFIMPDQTSLGLLQNIFLNHHLSGLPSFPRPPGRCHATTRSRRLS